MERMVRIRQLRTEGARYAVLVSPGGRLSGPDDRTLDRSDRCAAVKYLNARILEPRLRKCHSEAPEPTCRTAVEI